MFENNKMVNAFSEEEVLEIKKSIEHELSVREVVEWDDASMGGTYSDKKVRIKRDHLGRLEINDLPLSFNLRMKIWRIAQEMYQLDESFPKNMSGVTYVEYNPKYGNPELFIHKDNGQCGLILDYQLESNTSWDFGVEEKIYSLEDNSIIAMYPITHYHWRPEKVWNDGEFVKLIFFEFFTPDLVKVEDEQRKQEILGFIDSYNKENRL